MGDTVFANNPFDDGGPGGMGGPMGGPGMGGPSPGHHMNHPSPGHPGMGGPSPLSMSSE